MTRLKILFIAGWYPSEKNPVEGIFVKEYAKAVSLNNDVVVLYSQVADYSMRRLSAIISDQEEDGIRTIRVESINKLTYPLSIIVSARKLIKEGFKPDIIHAHVYFAGVPAVILGKLYGIPVVITEHYSGFPRKRLGRFETIMARFALNRANYVLPVSKNLEDSIRSYRIRNHFSVVPNTVDTEIFHPPKSRALEGTKRILLVSLFTPVKGIPYLFQALAKLGGKRDDFSLEIVGDGAKGKEYEELVSQLGIQEKVKFHGLKTKEEVAEFMRKADFFVLPSEWENLPCVLIEAMASGLPIIATNVGGIPEIVTDEIGKLVPAKDSDTLAEAIDYMLDHHKDYSAEEIAEYARKRYSYKVVGKKLDAIYKTLKST